MSDGVFNAMNAFLILGDVSKDEKTTREDSQKYQERIVFATMRSLIPNWEKPQGWDELPIEERENRIAKLRELSNE